jgi:predicted transcriptional regulator
MADLKITVGGSAKDDAAAFVDAWHRAERGDAATDGQRVVSFQSLDTFLSVLTAERLRLLRHLRRHPEASVSALARALHRDYRRVHGDVTMLEAAGLIDRSEGGVRATADRITAEANLV